MSLDMYTSSKPRFAHMLRNLATILSKAEEHARARRIEPSALLQARLFPDMFPLVRQVQIACDTAKGTCARLAGVDVPKHEDNEQTFEELQQRIAKVIAFMDSVPSDSIAASADRQVTLKQRDRELHFRGDAYLLESALPNFYFHVVTAYDILRHNGVELGKRDFLGNP
jgi:uncharacterized protein